MIDCPQTAQLLFQRLQPWLPVHGPRGGWVRCTGLNERLRFLKYVPGDYFRPHQDGRYVRGPGEKDAGDTSLMTVMIYLNTPEKGGDTNFLSYDHSHFSPVAPITGLALIFDHNILHEGATLERGVKYCIRTDCMYTRRGPEISSVPSLPAPPPGVAPPPGPDSAT